MMRRAVPSFREQPASEREPPRASHSTVEGYRCSGRQTNLESRRSDLRVAPVDARAVTRISPGRMSGSLSPGRRSISGRVYAGPMGRRILEPSLSARRRGGISHAMQAEGDVVLLPAAQERPPESTPFSYTERSGSRTRHLAGGAQ